MTKHHTAPAQCPFCHETLDGATNALADDVAAPKSGDYSVCTYCHTPLVFTDAMQLRRCTDDELRELLAILKRGTMTP